jgi:mannose-6-phosphate isomerase-like protein (cupin superfamily)
MSPHKHEDHEEIYYIINGTGIIKIGNEGARFRDYDIIYIPEKTCIQSQMIEKEW